MKSFYKLYALISVGFISAIIIMISIYPTEFMTFAEELFVIIQTKAPLLSIFDKGFGPLETTYAYLTGLYVVNIAANIVIWVLAYISENKFYNRLVLYALIINLVYFFIIYYTVKLLLESGVKTFRKILTKR